MRLQMGEDIVTDATDYYIPTIRDLSSRLTIAEEKVKELEEFIHAIEEVITQDDFMMHIKFMAIKRKYLKQEKDA